MRKIPPVAVLPSTHAPNQASVLAFVAIAIQPQTGAGTPDTCAGIPGTPGTPVLVHRPVQR